MNDCHMWRSRMSGAHQEADNDQATFPKTIEDSITVTKALGLRYLWVDRYVSPSHTWRLALERADTADTISVLIKRTNRINIFRSV
jgi:hypothetical protein